MCSMFSGKADIYDGLIAIGNVTDFSKVHIFADNNPVELRIDSYKDLIPYFPCVPYAEGHCDGEYNIHTSSKPYYRREEEQLLKIYIRDMITCYNKLKREKKLTLENLLDMYKERFCWYELTDSDKLLAGRVIEAKGHKERVKYDDIFSPMGDHYRKELYEHMVEHGWDEYRAKEWCYGWERIFDKKCPV